MSGNTGSTRDTGNTEFDELFAEAPLMVILRGLGVERSLELAHKAWDLGITSVELPIQTPADVEALRAVADAGRPLGKSVGAGTVITPEHVRQAKAAGAAFTVSPGYDREIVAASIASGLPPLPGVATATEVQLALRDGLTWLKAFPASVLGTGWFTAMRGPFPQVRFVATGGMDASNAQPFLDAGVRVVAVGSALADESQVDRLAALLKSA